MTNNICNSITYILYSTYNLHSIKSKSKEYDIIQDNDVSLQHDK